MSDTPINFQAPAIFKKWPGSNPERNQADSQRMACTIMEGTLDECIQHMKSKPAKFQSFYEIHTLPQGNAVESVLTSHDILVLSRLRDFL